MESDEVRLKIDIDDRSLTPDSVVTEDDHLIEELASDYNQYLNFDLSKDESKFSESVEDMLIKLDEFCSLEDMIRSDISLCLTKTLPGIRLKCHDMDAVFDKVDKLEAFVNVVRQNISMIETQVLRAEEQSGSFGGIMKKLSSIVSPKKKAAESKSLQQATFQPPDIFKTSDYFTASDKTVNQTHRRTDVTIEGLFQNITHNVHQGEHKTQLQTSEAGAMGDNSGMQGTKPDDKLSKKAGEEKPSDKLSEKAGEEKPNDKLSEKAGEEKPDDKLSEKAGEEKPNDKLSEKAGEEKPDDKLSEKAGEEKPSDKYVEEKFDSVDEKHIDTSEEKTDSDLSSPREKE